MAGRFRPTQHPTDLWARRFSHRPWAAAGVAVACLAALAALVVGDMRTDPTLTFGALAIVPLAAAGWLLSPALALAVTAAATAGRIADIAVGGVSPVTGAIQAVVGVGVGLLVIALAGSARSRIHMERRARGIRRLTRLLDALRSLGPESDAELSLGEILGAAASVLGHPEDAPRTFLAVVDEDRLTISLERNTSTGPNILGESFAAADAAALLPVLDDGATTIVGRRELRGSARKLMARAGIVTTVAARVRCSGRPHGLLCVAFEEDCWFDPEELRLLQALAHIAGISLDAASAVDLERRQAGDLRRRAEHIAELESMKREFLLLASHELRSPLGVARGYAAMLRDGTLGEPPASFQRALGIMEDKLGEIAALVDDMLETARLETGNLGLSDSDVDLRDVVQTAVAQVQPVVTERHHLELELPGKPVVVRGDTERLRRIAVNLLDNAVKYSPQGGAVHCAVDVCDHHAEVRVHDQGLGIAADAQARMFQRFGRIVTPQTSNIPGTGLGLYLCRELARAHGGDITMESREGEGSTFTLTLPLRGNGGGPN
jgi:signal transduction histidine kinase